MSKKSFLTITGILLAAFCVIIILIVVFGVYFKGTTTVSLGNTDCISGDTVKLPLTIDNNHGIWAGLLKINYDSSTLEFVSCANGTVFDECEVEVGNDTVKIIVNMSELQDVKENGLVVNLSFKVKENAKKGNYNVELNADTEFCDINGDLKEVLLESGVITVK